MLDAEKISRSEKVFLLVFIPLLLLSYLLNLGLQPIYMEEPKRALVAMEMILNDNYWMPTQFGIPYFNKPPLYNWLLCGVFHLTGSYSEFSLRILSVVSFLLLGLVNFIFTRKYMGAGFALTGTLLLLVSVDIYYYFSLTGEIDLFYSLLVFCNIAVIYYFSDRGQYFIMFLLAYFLAALGMLTKSFPTVLFLGISLLLVLWLKKDLKKLFTLSHLAGIILFAAIIGSYLLMYSTRHDAGEMLSALWYDSSKRTLMENPVQGLFIHILSFPLETLKNLLPASVLLVFAFRRSLLTSIRKHPFVFFSLLVFLLNITVYLLSPTARQRYIYALYPFLINVLVFLYFDFRKGWKEKYLHVLTWIILSAGLIMSVSLPFIPQFEVLHGMVLLSIVLVIFTFLLMALHFRRSLHPVLIMAAMFVLVRIAFDLTVLPLRAQDEHASVRKQDGQAIAAIAGESPVHLWRGSNISNGMVYYIVRETGRPVNRVYEIDPDAFYIMDENHFDTHPDTTCYESKFRDIRFRLVKFLE